MFARLQWRNHVFWLQASRGRLRIFPRIFPPIMNSATPSIDDFMALVSSKSWSNRLKCLNCGEQKKSYVTKDKRAIRAHIRRCIRPPKTKLKSSGPTLLTEQSSGPVTFLAPKPRFRLIAPKPAILGPVDENSSCGSANRIN